MNEPPRMRDENPTALERRLLTAGSAYRSSPLARQKTLAGLGLAATAAASASAATAATSSLQKVGLVKLLTLSSIGVAVLAPIGIVAWNKLEGPKESLVVSAPPTKTPEARAIEPTALPEPAIAEPAEAPAADAPAPKSDARATSGALAAELAVLDVARSKLSAGDPRGALGVLDEYARTYPRGRLDVEAQVLRIDALAKAGETEAARKRAEAFLKRHPKSVLASRVRRYLDDPR